MSSRGALIDPTPLDYAPDEDADPEAGLADPDLLAALHAGAAHAWTQTVRRHRRLVRARIGAFRLQPSDAADAEQATWLRLAEHAHSIRSADALPGWLSVVARRECLAILRKAAAAPVFPPDAAADVPDPGVAPEQRVVDLAQARALRQAVARLPARQRKIVAALYGTEPLAYSEIERRTAIPVGSIGPTRARALARLRRALEDEPGAVRPPGNGAGPAADLTPDLTCSRIGG
jgi:RNA polymerase sigma factor (sigma-70 family)